MLYHFDQMIVCALEVQQQAADWSREHRDVLTRLQRAASQLVPGACSIALGIRELIRQGYLFPGFMLLRPMVERVATVSYLIENPETLGLWEEGWPYAKRPKLTALLAAMKTEDLPAETADLAPGARDVANHYNSLTHGDPASAQANLVIGLDGLPAYSVSKDLDSPDKAEDLAAQGAMYLIVLTARTLQVFPEMQGQPLRS